MNQWVLLNSDDRQVILDEYILENFALYIHIFKTLPVDQIKTYHRPIKPEDPSKLSNSSIKLLLLTFAITHKSMLETP